MELTIAIISYNKLKYIKSLLKSLNDIKIDNLEIIVIDNGSIENGLLDFLELQLRENIISKLFKLKENNICKTKNLIFQEANFENVLILTDELNFVGNNNILQKYLEDFNNNDCIYLDLCATRNSTIFKKINYPNSFLSKNNIKYWYTKTNDIQKIGLFKKYAFKEVGDYPLKKKNIDVELLYSLLLKKKYLDTDILNSISLVSHIPLFVTIWNDPRGNNCFIENGKRYGHYLDPNSESGLYYKHIDDLEFEKLMKYRFPLGFINIAKPINWKYAVTENKEQMKYDRRCIINEGPETNI